VKRAALPPEKPENRFMTLYVLPNRTRAWISRIVIACVTGLALSYPFADAQAQGWPTRPVKLIVPFAPGGTADLFGRIAADELSRAFKRQFVVENRGGAGGLLGSAAVASADADGYTLLVSGIPTLVVAPAASAKPPFDPMRAFSHIAYLGGVPLVLIANPSVKATGYKELVALARSSNSALGYVSPGAGTHAHLFGDYLARKENIRLEHIPYKGAAPAMLDLIAGHVPLGVMSWSASIEQIRAGKVKALAVSSENRLPEYPDVQTFKELGYEDLTAATWFSLSGPANMPRDIVDRINSAIVRGLQSPDTKKRLAQEVVEVRLLTPDAFTRFVEDEIARWRPIIKAMAPVKN
jgi:tripartite-type tricarboxylate transporter receptor subunit TctC